MKVSTVKQEFQPVVITLETQKEVDQMFQIVKFNDFPEEDDITLGIYNLLADLVSDSVYKVVEETYLNHVKEE